MSVHNLLMPRPEFIAGADGALFPSGDGDMAAILARQASIFSQQLLSTDPLMVRTVHSCSNQSKYRTGCPNNKGVRVFHYRYPKYWNRKSTTGEAY